MQVCTAVLPGGEGLVALGPALTELRVLLPREEKV